MGILTKLSILDTNINDNLTDIVTFAEGAKLNVYGGTRYGAFPPTHTTAPLDTIPTPADLMAAKYANEPISLNDIGVPNTKFTLSSGVGFRYEKPDGELGYYISFISKLTVDDIVDQDYMETVFSFTTNIGDVITFIKTVDYGNGGFDTNWVAQVAT